MISSTVTVINGEAFSRSDLVSAHKQPSAHSEIKVKVWPLKTHAEGQREHVRGYNEMSPGFKNMRLKEQKSRYYDVLKKGY